MEPNKARKARKWGIYDLCKRFFIVDRSTLGPSGLARLFFGALFHDLPVVASTTSRSWLFIDGPSGLFFTRT